MFRRWRRDRQLGKVKPGDGSALPAFRFRDRFGGRSLFFISLPEGADPEESHVYTVDARYYAEKLSQRALTAEDDRNKESDAYTWLKDTLGEGMTDALFGGDEYPVDEKKSATPPVTLYRDGRQIARANLPTAFAVPGGVIEVASTYYGLKRIHYVTDDDEKVLRPHRSSPEGMRARVAKRFPTASRIVGWLAIVILLVGLVTGIPQGLQLITEIPPVAERFGTFESPFQFPACANYSLLIAGMFAAFERALTLKNHWFIDLDTTWSAFG